MGNAEYLKKLTIDVTPSTPDATDYLPVRLTDGSSFSASGVVSETLNSPQTTHATSSALAAGSNVDLDSDQINSGLTGKLTHLMVASSVPCKAQLYTVSNGVASSVLATWFTPQRPFLDIYKGYITVAHDATAGLDGFRVNVTNLDPANAADVYVTFFYDEE